MEDEGLISSELDLANKKKNDLKKNRLIECNSSGHY